MTDPISRSLAPNSQFERSAPKVENRVPATSSTLQSIQRESHSASFLDLLLRPIAYIWKLFESLGSVIVSCLRWCFGINREDAAFWQKAKKEFERIYIDTCLLESSPNLKAYTQKVAELSDAVKAQYKRHILKAHAEHVYPSQTALEQGKWMNDNFKTFNFDPYFNMTKSHPVIVNAVKSYWEEIKANQP